MSEQKPYNPHDHLVKIRSKDGAMKDYLPASWPNPYFDATRGNIVISQL